MTSLNSTSAASDANDDNVNRITDSSVVRTALNNPNLEGLGKHHPYSLIY